MGCALMDNANGMVVIKDQGLSLLAHIDRMENWLCKTVMGQMELDVQINVLDGEVTCNIFQSHLFSEKAGLIFHSNSKPQ